MDSEEPNSPSEMRFFSTFFSLFVLVFFFLCFLFFLFYNFLSGKQLEKGNIQEGEDDT